MFKNIVAKTNKFQLHLEHVVKPMGFTTLVADILKHQWFYAGSGDEKAGGDEGQRSRTKNS